VKMPARMSIDSIIASNPNYQKTPTKSNIGKRELHEWANSTNFSGIIREIRWLRLRVEKMINLKHSQTLEHQVHYASPSDKRFCVIATKFCMRVVSASRMPLPNCVRA